MQLAPDDLAIRASSDPEAFVQLYNTYFQRVYSYIYYRCDESEDVEDLTAKVFERLMSCIGRYSQQKGPFEAWLFAIVRNIVNDHYRGRRFLWLPLDQLLHKPAGDPTPEEEATHSENLDELQRALQKLDRRSRDFISLKFYARLTNREIARMTHHSESSVGVVLYRAIGRLRQLLSSSQENTLTGCLEKELNDERA
jgi:RNA polymerase sigma factor (sigma-70 family)